MKKKNRNRTANIIDSVLNVPKEVSTGLPKITILGFNEILIENYRGVLEYENIYVRISTFIGIINISGYGFNLKQMTEDDILILGQIDSIELEKDNIEEN